MNLLQDILGLIARKKKVKPIDTDVLPIGRYKSSKEILKPKPEMKTSLVSLKELKDYVSKGSSDENTFITDLDVNNFGDIKITRNDGVEFTDSIKLNPQQIAIDPTFAIPKIYEEQKDAVVDLADWELWPFRNDGWITSLLYVKYDLGGGQGHYTIILPDATHLSIKNLQVRIISDSSVDANQEVHIKAGTYDEVEQTIDGSTEAKQINRNYEGITLWSDGSEWIVIQAKAH
jgi:hypothetical protein